MASMMLAFYGLVNVPDVIAGEAPLPGLDVDVNVTANPLVWDFLIAIDTNANAIPDTAITGQITFSEDPTDGFLPGATLHFVFAVTTPLVAGPVDTGTLTGSGDLLATIGATEEQATISGTISLNDTSGEGCTADITFPVSPPVNLDFSGGFVPPPVGQLAANTGIFEIFGTIQAAIETLGYTFNADVTFVADDQTVGVDGDIDGNPVDFDFELLPPDQVIANLFGCLFVGFDWTFFFSGAYESIATAIGGGTLPPGVVLTPTANPNVINYTIDLAAFEPGSFTAGMVSGQATLTFPTVQLSGISPSQVAFTWTIAGAVFTGGDTTSGQNLPGRPFRIRLDGTGALISLSGAGSLTLGGPALSGGIPLPAECTVLFDILETDPILANETDGTALVTITVGEDVMTVVVDFAEEEIFSMINGIPFPFFPF
ncbi:MAG: hypothetical protein L0206_16525 [Actinobacteria bacterium]|nr:hypothetical protein [Actinomycetota bacterium]